MRLLRIALLLALAFLCMSTTSFAQNYLGLGTPGDTIENVPVQLGAVNTESGNLNLTIPIASFPQRAGPPLVLKLVYNSGLWDLTRNVPGPNNWYANGIGGMKFVFAQVELGFVQADQKILNNCPGTYPNGTTKQWYNLRYVEPGGAATPLTNTTMYGYNCFATNGTPDPANSSYQTVSYPILGGTTGKPYVSLTLKSNYSVVSSTAWLQDGTGGPAPIQDTNGNILRNAVVSDLGPTQFTSNFFYPDQVGRSMLALGSNCSVTGSQSCSILITQDAGSPATYTFNTQTLPVCTNFPPVTGQATTQFCGSMNFLTSMQLPDGTQYTFSYDTGSAAGHYGSLSGITLPSGGQLSYGYSVITSRNAGYYTTAVTSVSDGYGITSLSYTYVPGSAYTTTVTKPQRYDVATQTTVQDRVIATYSNLNQRTKTEYYSGSSASPSLTITYTWMAPLSYTVKLNDTSQSATVTYSYSGYTNLPSSLQESDFGGAVIRTTISTYTGDSTSNYTANHILDRLLSRSVYPGANTTGSPLAKATYTYDEYTASYCKNGTPMLTNILGATGHDDTKDTTYIYRGNPTTFSHLVSGSTYITDHACYDTLGNMMQRVDYNQNPTSLDYADTWSNTTCIPAGNVSRAAPTTITNALGHQDRTAYYTCSGLRQSVRNQNDINAGRTGGSYSYDMFARGLNITYPDGGSLTNSYTDTPGAFSVLTTTPITSGLSKLVLTTLDGLLRKSGTQLTNDPSGTDYTDISYDPIGRVQTESNPHRSASASTDGITRTDFDAIGRVTQITQPDGSVISETYTGNCSVVKDEAGQSRKSCVDALGRITGVWEDPIQLNYEADYVYDGLDDLLSVTQKGGATSGSWRTRSFQYDALSRLKQASNPEAGTTTYSYVNSSGGLCSGDPHAVCGKIAPSPNQLSTGTSLVTTTYAYDALNRLTNKSYQDGYVGNTTTSADQYGYDGVSLTGCVTSPPGLADSNPIGLRTSMCDGSGASSWNHDPMGRIKQERRTIGLVAGNYETYSYNLDGSPSGVTALGYGIAYTYNGAGRMTSVKNSADPFNYVVSITYAPFGGLTSASMGSHPITITDAYNNRSQPLLISATASSTIVSLCYDFHLKTSVTSGPCSFSVSPTGDNGNIFQIQNTRDNNRTQNFLYDSLNRIQQAYSNGTNWGETFAPTPTSPGVAPSTSGIDAWGNLTNRSGVTGKTSYEPLSCSANTSNQLNTCFSYDAAGNLTRNGAATYTYDAESRLIAAGGMSYIYDGDGKRVEKCTSGTSPGSCATGATGTLYWTGPVSDALAETDLAGTPLENYIFFNGRRIARRDASTKAVHYYFSDHLGTHSLVTNANGDMPPEYESDFYPYGGEVPITGGGSGRYKFTGKERDSESGLDNFGARYNASTMGRFMTPDVFYKDSHVGDPQSWNEYAYARNNPLRYVDPTGETATVSSSCSTDANNHTTCNVNISASIAIYAQPGSNLNQDQLNQAAGTIQSSIQNAWSGSFTQDGVSYNVSTQVSVSVAGSQDAAMSSGAQNVIGISNGNASATADSFVNPRLLTPGAGIRGIDTGVWNINSLGTGVAAHEFTHLLGVGDRKDGELVLSNTDFLNNHNIPHTATSSDFGWGVKEATQSVGLGLAMKSWYNGSGGPLPTPFRFSSTDTVGAPWGAWWK